MDHWHDVYFGWLCSSKSQDWRRHFYETANTTGVNVGADCKNEMETKIYKII
jgi:hypothetical protein